MEIDQYLRLVENELLTNIRLESISPFDPIIVKNRSKTWQTIGSGNYAAVFFHDDQPEWVVKVYGRNHEELKKEMEVYKNLGNHETFSTLYGYGEQFLVLKKLEGITLFNALVKGIYIPETVIQDIDNGLSYAKSVGLNPYDVHGKNVVMNKGRGYIVDISDFYKIGYCSKWDDLKKAYFRLYKPFIGKCHPPIPFSVVDGIRKGYRVYKKMKKKIH
jgi:predicted Ser/Thr protein kinase